MLQRQPSSPRFAFALLAAAALALGTGCDSGDSESDDEHDEHEHGAEGTEGGEHTEDCGQPGEIYAAGMSKEGSEGKYRFALLTSEPGPPEKHENVWTIAITDNATEEPVTGAMVMARPWMTEHEHGSSPEHFAFEESADAPGTYSVTLDLFMGGLWEVFVTVGPMGEEPMDEASFMFCIEA